MVLIFCEYRMEIIKTDFLYRFAPKSKGFFKLYSFKRYSRISFYFGPGNFKWVKIVRKVEYHEILSGIPLLFEGLKIQLKHQKPYLKSVQLQK